MEAAPAVIAQDVLVVTAPGSGAEIIPFLKTWVNLPMAIGFTVLYAKVHTRVRSIHCPQLCTASTMRLILATGDEAVQSRVLHARALPQCAGQRSEAVRTMDLSGLTRGCLVWPCSWPTCCQRSSCSTRASSPSSYSLAPSPSSCTPCATCCTPQVHMQQQPGTMCGWAGSQPKGTTAL